MKTKKVLIRLLVVVLQVVFVLAGLEVGLRLLKPHHRGVRQLLYRSTEATRYEQFDNLANLMNESPVGFRPNAVENGFVLNSRSFRTVEYQNAKPDSCYRVLAIGDSFTYGVVPDADHWTTLLRDGLSDGDSKSVEVLRLGVPGTGTPFQLRLWQIEGSQLDPDLVILAFFVGNDFFDELGSAPGLTGMADRISLVSYTFRFVRNVSRLWSLRSPELRVVASEPREAQSSTTPHQSGIELPEFAVRFAEDRPTIDEQTYLRIEAERMSICLLRERWKFDLRLRRVTSLLLQFANEVRSAGPDFIVLLIPDEFQVDQSLFSATAAFAGRDEAAYDLELPQRALRSFLNQNSIPYIDLLPSFRDRAEGARLYMVQDSHWNRAGNHLAAEFLLDRIAGAHETDLRP